MGSKASLKISFPKEVGDAAVLLVEQMWVAVTEGQVVIARPEFADGLAGWLKCAANVLNDADNPSDGQSAGDRT